MQTWNSDSSHSGSAALCSTTRIASATAVHSLEANCELECRSTKCCSTSQDSSPEMFDA